MLTSEQLATFQQDGALVVPGVLGGDWLKRVRGDFDFRVDDLLARYNLPGGGDFCAKMSRLLAKRPDAYEHIDHIANGSDMSMCRKRIGQMLAISHRGVWQA